VIKELGKRFFRALGLEVSRTSLERNFTRNIAWHCLHKKVDLCLDVGANTGQFAAELRASGYSGQILSFEPLHTAHCELLKRSAADSRWDVAPRVAIGDRTGEIVINVANNSASSSVLPMLAKHLEAAPHSKYVDQETVRIITLDEFIRGGEFSGTFDSALLKIDTQGYEGAVLRGSTEVLSRVRLVVLEMSLVPLYEGSQTFIDLYQTLSDHGFRCANINPMFYDRQKHELLQVDGLFAR